MNTNRGTARKTIIEFLQDLKESNPSLFNCASYNEQEYIYTDSSDIKSTLTFRVNKLNEMDAQEFRENLYDALSDSCGNKFATDFINEEFKIEVGLSVGDTVEGLEACELKTGDKVKVKPEKGQVLMVDFWATWCGFCQAPMQENIDLIKSWSVKPDNIQIYGVSCDENADKWKNHINEKGWGVINHYNRADARNALGIVSIPCIYLTDVNCKIAYIGHPNKIQLKESLVSLSNGGSVVFASNSDNVNGEFALLTTTQEKIDRVNKAYTIIKEEGCMSVIFSVYTTYKLDMDTFEMKAVKVLPFYSGEILSMEEENTRKSADKITHLFSNPDFKIEVKSLLSEDF